LGEVRQDKAIKLADDPEFTRIAERRPKNRAKSRSKRAA
jgi:hypothetical protein